MSPPPLEQYATWEDVKHGAETFRLYCAIKQTTYDNLIVVRDFEPSWNRNSERLLLPYGGIVELRLELIGVKDTEGTVYYVGYFCAEHKGKHYVTMPIYKERQ